MSHSVRPDHNDAFWHGLATREWRRSRTAPADAICLAFGLPIHRQGTYYRRPAYTDGVAWLSQQAYDTMMQRTRGQRADRAIRGNTENDT